MRAGIIYFLTLGLGTVTAASSCSAPPASSFPVASAVPNSQALKGSEFVGAAVGPNRLAPQSIFLPDASLMHGDSGNTGSTKYPGPLGLNTTATSAAGLIGIYLWGRDGSLTMGFGNASSEVKPPPRGLAAVDPASLRVLAAWFPPDANETISISYIEYLLDTDDVIVSSEEGHIYVVHRDTCDGTPFFTLTRSIDLRPLLQESTGNFQLLNTMVDSVGNLWFSTGAVLSGERQQNATIVGYVTPSGDIVSKRIDNQMVENGIAITNTTVFMVTGPSGTSSTANATGYMWALSARNDEVKVIWQAPYDAGSGFKPGGFARGSGSTPALLDDQFVVITDNADSQIKLLVYHQDAQPTAAEQIACQVPLFQPGASANDLGAIVHNDGDKYSAAIVNTYNSPPLVLSAGPGFDINGIWNNVSVMAPGLAKVDINLDGSTCTIAWETDLRMKAVPLLSTETGLFYGYIQDPSLANEGDYVWYLVAVDWVSGKVVWKKRAGAGGTFNDNFQPASLSPDGQIYQSVLGGVVTAKDGV